MLKKIETVLIGTSLTEASDLVVRTGLKVARAASARVALVHACPPHLIYAGVPWVPELPEVVEAEKERVRRRLEEQAQRLGIRPEERAATIVELGPPHQVLIATGRETDADLIVVGAAEEPILAKLLGSTADRVVRRAACPVFVVRRELPMPPARVLLPVDLSPLSAETFREGLRVLELLAGERGDEIRLEAFHVVDPDASGETPEMAHFIGRSALEVVPRTVTGYVEDEILTRIRDWEPSLVVLGTHGRNGFERFLLGSVATRIVHNGDANVLIVPPAAAREPAEGSPACYSASTQPPSGTSLLPARSTLIK